MAVTVPLLRRNLRRYALVPLYPLVWPLAHLIPRRRGLWLFAYAFGYKDNPRYLYDHVRSAGLPEVRPVWFAQTKDEAAAVAKTGGEAVWKRSPRAWVLQLRAGVVVMGFGPSDLNRPLIGRAYVVQTWHGAPFKHIHADFPDGDVLLPGTGLISRLGNRIVRWATNISRSRVDLLPAQSPMVATRFQSAFRIGAASTPVLGTPRNDVIGATGPEAEAQANRLRASILPPHLSGVAKLVLYAPTWRDGHSETLLAKGFDVRALDSLLAEHDAAMVIRMHPQSDRQVFEDAGVGSTERVFMDASRTADINVLLRAVDCLITDYSATSVDFALLGRPIVYFMPDLAAYEGGRGLYESPSLLTGGLHSCTWHELHVHLSSALQAPGRYIAAAKVVADRYTTHRDTESCSRITDAILSRRGSAQRAVIATSPSSSSK